MAEQVEKSDRVDFATQIFPLLMSRCADCHGSENQEGQLRLDARAAVFGGGVSGPALVKGKAADSLLFQRVAGVGEGDRMPLEEEPLSDDQIALLKRWIEQGAAWPDGIGEEIAVERHWAYEKPVRPALPKVADASWPQNPIDYFVLARLAAEKLKPSPAASKAALLRRVYLDLVGLPPTADEVAAFESDTSDDAYERVVDRLLASPHYGERWARPWLDAARYADSNGYQADQYREVWPFRDWVVDALNADMPFDQFSIEQIAGDLLPKATVQQKIATGFHRQTTCNVEAGVDPEENRVNQVIDRVNTTGTVWLGTTLECVQCHNHPYDPFTQRDYYRFLAFFNNTPLEVKHTSATTYDFFGPKLDVPLEGQASAKDRKLKAQYQEQRQAYDRRMDELIAQQGEWERRVLEQHAQADGDESGKSPWRVVDVLEFESSGGASHKVLDDGSVLISGARPDKDTYTLVAKSDASQITAVKLEALTHPSLPGQGPGRHHAERPNFVLHEFNLKVSPLAESDDATGEFAVGWSEALADFSQRQFDVRGAIDGNPTTGWAIHQEFHKPHWAVFRAAKPQGYEAGTKLHLELTQNHGETRTLGRFRISVCEGVPPEAQKAQSPAVPESILKIIKTPAASRDEDLIGTLRDYYLAQQADLKKLEGELAALKSQLGEEATATALVMVEMNEPRETRLFYRGDFLNPRNPVAAGTPASLHPLGQFEAQDASRLALARWLVSADNPLTARVQVNRWWAEIFGRGIVRTVEDFGTQGEAPSHPELLDWLAAEFMQPTEPGDRTSSDAKPRPWSMKHIHKLIVMSAAYQQQSRITPAQRERDPQNVLLARGPRLRMSAEMIRDNALAISGLLSPKMGGPPVFPPQPDGIWRHVGRNAPQYKIDTGEDRYRRGLYVIWRRSAPYPSFVNFDAPDRAACVVSRSRTNTPLQALTLLNDESYVEMAWALARRIAARPVDESAKDDDTQSRARWAWRTAVARAPSTAEVEYIVSLFESQRKRYGSDEGAARKLVGQRTLPADVRSEELAAWFYVATVLLNLDETITKN